MFRKALSLLLLVAFLLPQFSTVWILLRFKLNQEYIAETLCINLDKPETLCSGKCYLFSQLKQEEKKVKETPFASLREKAESGFFALEPLAPPFPAWEFDPAHKAFFREALPYSCLFIFEILRPPRLLTV